MSWKKPDIQQLFDVLDATWAPHDITQRDGWRIREGKGGGKRVSAADQIQVGADILAAETAMHALGQTPLFMIRDGYPTLEMQLAKRDYAIADPVTMFAKPTDDTADGLPVDFLDTPSDAQLAIWDAGGIDADRIAVMNRVTVPKTYLQVAGATAFAALHDDVAMVHAVEVATEHRRQGLGRTIMQAASMWAAMKNAHTVSVIATRANRAAQGLYKSMGYKTAGSYHYRIKRQ